MRRLLLALALVSALAFPAGAAEVLRFEGDYQELTFINGKRSARPMHLQIWETQGGGVRATAKQAILRLSNGASYPVVSAFVSNRSAVYLGVCKGVSVVVHFGLLPEVKGAATAPVTAQMLVSTGGAPRPVPGTWHFIVAPPAGRP